MKKENPGAYMGGALCQSLLLFFSLFLQVQKLAKGEILMVNIGSMSTGVKFSPHLTPPQTPPHLPEPNGSSRSHRNPLMRGT